MKVAIIGGGISGLSAAWRLRQAGCEIVVFEADERIGGKIRSEQVDGYLVEHGPNGFLDSRQAVLDLVRDLGVEDRLLRADKTAARRYVYVRGRLRALPSSPPAFLTNDVLSLGGRLRALLEPFMPGRKEDGDETAYEFAARRIGKEAASVLVDAMVTGIYAGEAKKLSMPAAFPKLVHLEREHGSLFRGMLALRKAKKRASDDSRGGPTGPAGTLTSFAGGLEELIGALGAKVGDAVQTGRPVERIWHDGQWQIGAVGGEPVCADAVVATTAPRVMARLLGPHAPAAVEPLEGIPDAPAAVVALGFEAKDLPRRLDGFGFLVPSGENRKVLGVLWSSTLYAGRAPAGKALLRAIVGGTRNPALVDLSDGDLVQTVLEELSLIMGPMPTPVFEKLVRWPAAIPQYTLGHVGRVRAAEEAAATLPGVYLEGNGLHGISLADCVGRAVDLPGRVLRG